MVRGQQVFLLGEQVLLLRLLVAPRATVGSPSAVMGSHCLPLSRGPLPVGWVGRAGTATMLLSHMSQPPKGSSPEHPAPEGSL